MVDKRVKALLDELADMGFRVIKVDGVCEQVFQRQVWYKEQDQKIKLPYFVRIFSTLENGKFRLKGEDAIRVQAIDDAEKIVFCAKDTRRTENIKKMLLRMRKRARICWAKAVQIERPQEEAPAQEGLAAVAAEAVQQQPTSNHFSVKQNMYYKKLTGKNLPAHISAEEASKMLEEAKQKAQGAPASEKQHEFIKKLAKMRKLPSLTKKEASEYIGKLIQANAAERTRIRGQLVRLLQEQGN